MNNAHSDGNTITVPAPAGGAVSGQPFAYGVLLAIPVTDAGEGEPVAAAIEGAFVLPKASATVIAGGASVGWDNTDGVVGTGGDVAAFGVAIADAGDGEVGVVVKLTPGGAPAAGGDG